MGTAEVMLAGDRVVAGRSWSTILPAMDFETYSEAGYKYDEAARKWRPITNSPPYGLGAVGASAYSEHPSTEILSLAYDLKDGSGPSMWLPSMPPPEELFEYLARGGLVEAWNTSFEFFIWNNVGAARLGWPSLHYTNLRDAMAKAFAFSLPGKLEKAGEALEIENLKIADGTRLLTKFSKPRKPTKKDPRLRLRPEDDPVDGPKLYEYNIGDIKAQSEISAQVPDLIPEELDLWLFDQRVNFRGVAIDLEALEACTAIVDQASEKYTRELFKLTSGAVDSASKIQKIAAWLDGRGVYSESLDMEQVETLLKQPIPPDARRVLEIRQTLGSASVKKLRAINNRISLDGRIRDLFQFCGAQRTGRFAGRGPQPQNLPNSGPQTRKCSCGRRSGLDRLDCAWCGRRLYHDVPPVEWGLDAVHDALIIIKTKDLATVERYFGEAIPVVMGCLRALFVAGPDCDLVCSDYSSIEAVILAELAGETWRQEVFRTHGKIYETSASMITGVPFEEFMRYKRDTGDHHPLRKKIGKYAELASGYQGWIGAWKAFGADKHLSDKEIKDAIIKWRAASPAIADKETGYWAKLNNAAIRAIANPGECFAVGQVAYGVRDDILYCQLPSGRCLTYHKPRLEAAERYGRPYTQITYMGWNSDPKKGPLGWARLELYGGKCAENIVQATGRDVFVFGMLNAERAGYPMVLHTHDEPVAEVAKGFGSVEELETILSTMPPWARGWPIKAVGGWRGRQYRKD